jgi:hypothetical protein
MPRGLFFLIIVAVLLVGGLVFLSTRATEVPTKTIEVDVAAPANAS